ncbi:MAG: ATP-dependent DNA helicase [Candidatus Bathyarchaeota archaeon]|nr:MAG: ATP-dependent DNA helicase [Candidatus Bathyarchaeota archaeon]
MPQAYCCRKCGRKYCFEEFEENRFCRDCGTYLMSEHKASKFLKGIPAVVKSSLSKKGTIPDNYVIRRGQLEFVEEASRAIKKKEVFLGSAPCGIGKSLASLLAVLPHLETNKLMICFRTRSQLHIYLKELKALAKNLSVLSFFNKKDMCPLYMNRNLSYFDFSEECKQLKDNCESSIKPYCKFYRNNIKGKREVEELALNCAQQILTPREAVRLMSKRGFCTYEAFKRVLPKVNIFLGTYHYVFDSKIRETILRNFGATLSRVLLIVDEAHNLPAFARELLSDKLTKNTIERAYKETEKFKHESQPFIRKCLEILMEQVFQNAQQALKSEELRRLHPQKVSDLILSQNGASALEAAEILLEYGEFIKEKKLELGSEQGLSYNYRVGTFMENFFGNNGRQYIHLVEKDQRSRIALEVRSLDGREITDHVLRQAKGSILMSGFLSPPKVYRDLTLYETNNVYLKELDSPFPPENRTILVASDVSSKFKQRTGLMLRKWRDYIEAISKTNKGNIAVFFTSYGLMHKVLPLIRTDRTIIVEKREMKRNDVIKQLTRSSFNMLSGVMGGKFSEGMDYPNNILTCMVAIGLPYATWDVYQESLINYLENQFPENGRKYAYLTPAILRLIQTCGRVHRSSDDQGCIIILDERVTHEGIKQLFPRYFQEEMIIVKNSIECAKQVKEFWTRLSIA